MRGARLTAILGVAVLLSGPGVARAGVITSVISVGGPGGTGAALPLTSVPNNDNVVVGNTDLLIFSETFTAVAPIDAVFAVSPSAGTTEYFASNVTVNNTTGVSWVDFHFSLIPAVAGDGLDFDTPTMDPTPTSSAFMTRAHGQDTLDWSGGVVPSGGVVVFSFSIDVPDVSGNTFTLRGIPSIAQAAVPEPSSLALGGSALLSLLGYGRWCRKRATRMGRGWVGLVARSQ
jgi:hypothetical protein